MTDFVNNEIVKKEAPYFMLGFLLVMLSLILLVCKAKLSNDANEPPRGFDSQVEVHSSLDENVMLSNKVKVIDEVNSSE